MDGNVLFLFSVLGKLFCILYSMKFGPLYDFLTNQENTNRPFQKTACIYGFCSKTMQSLTFVIYRQQCIDNALRTHKINLLLKTTVWLPSQKLHNAQYLMISHGDI